MIRYCYLTLFILIQHYCFSQDDTLTLDYYLPDNVTYNTAIPTPQSILGFVPGQWHVSHDRLVSYMYALAAASNRVTIENRGKTFEERPLILLTITSPQNHQQLGKIQEDHVKLVTKEGNDLNTAQMPVVVYEGFTIHGNEPSGSNAALITAYYLAAAQGDTIEQLLDETVILLDPCMNPDGLQRFTHWVNTNKSQNINPDPQDREYSEAWPRGRTNHYWFDMNRDWLPVQLPESRVRVKTFHEWYPNILTDHHEMGSNSSYFFQPGVPSRTHPLTPTTNQELTKKISLYHAKALDKVGSFYYSEENFDDFYYGKGSTFPDINGSIGILFEQGSSRGHAQNTDNGLLTFPFTIRNQFITTLSTLTAAQALRVELLDHQQKFYQTARNQAPGGAYAFGNEKDAGAAYHLAEILKRHKIDVHEVKNEFKADGKTFKQGYSYIVPKQQRQNKLIQAMFERRTTFQDSLFYDISAWTFPLAFNLDFTESASLGNAGEAIDSLVMRTPEKIVQSNYAYLMEWHEYYAPKALNAILNKGLRAKVAMQPFTLSEVTYDYGTILIPVQNQVLSKEALHLFLQQVSEEASVDIQPVSTGLAEGIDLGSNQFRALQPAKVALVVGDRVNPYDAGEIWHLLDTRYQMLVTKLEAGRLGRYDLSKYTDIILPSQAALNAEVTDKLKTWVQQGGTLIGYRQVAHWLKDNQLLDIEI
ncbi:MAG: M14 family metallopeptidase [Thermonemataceae bacterium]